MLFFSDSLQASVFEQGNIDLALSDVGVRVVLRHVIEPRIYVRQKHSFPYEALRDHAESGIRDRRIGDHVQARDIKNRVVEVVERRDAWEPVAAIGTDQRGYALDPLRFQEGVKQGRVIFAVAVSGGKYLRGAVWYPAVAVHIDLQITNVFVRPCVDRRRLLGRIVDALRDLCGKRLDLGRDLGLLKYPFPERCGELRIGLNRGKHQPRTRSDDVRHHRFHRNAFQIFRGPLPVNAAVRFPDLTALQSCDVHIDRMIGRCRNAHAHIVPIKNERE